MLLSRVGRKKKRLWPWFEPPVPEAPMRYAGWVWVPEQKEWWPEPVPSMWVKARHDPYPKPERPPKYGAPTEVPGWSWSVKNREWVATIIMAEPVEFTPPRSLPPDVNLASVFPADPYFAKDLETALRLVEMGAWDTLQGGNAFMQLVYQVHKLCPDAKYPVQIAEGVFDARNVMHAKKTWLASQEAWQMRVNELMPKAPDYFGTTIAVLILGTAAALTGWLIGSIMERLTFPEVDMLTLEEPPGTYLMRYDHYLYSKMIELTNAAKPYYSACGDIGTSYIRHRRPGTKEGIDIIDFPGGLVEEGHKGIYYVKYTWHYWKLKYVGMLTSYGEIYYALREGDRDPRASGRRPFRLKASEWCTGFDWYL